ncbi:MAG TPA: hypothetical protein VFZ57_12570 [Thermoanaerobaculia bacterium]|nr:hypothetical protein [Thermoanaerobaculia bacterium]
MLIPQGLDARLRKAAQRKRVSRGEWVRRAIERSLKDERAVADPLEKLERLGGPTADIGQMLAEIEAGRI